MVSRLAGLALFGVGFTLSPVGVSAGHAPLTAVLLRIEGNVSVEEAGGSSRSRSPLPVVRRARPLQVLAERDAVHLPAGSRVELVCSDDRWLEWKGAREQLLTVLACRGGRQLLPGTYLRFAPRDGRMISTRGAMVLEGETRAPWKEDFGSPLTISPRNTAILDGRPTFRWRPVAEATEYELEITGAVHFRARIAAPRASCDEEWEGVAVCSLPYPAAEPELPVGEVALLSIGSRRGSTAPLRQEKDPIRVRRLPLARAESLRARLASLDAIPLEPAARELLAADLYAKEGVLGEAIAIYRSALARLEVPEMRVTLGDLYRRCGLFRLAALSFQRVATEAVTELPRAAAEQSLASMEALRGNFEAALASLGRARDLYRALGLRREVRRVERSMKKVERRHRSSLQRSPQVSRRSQ